MGGGAPGRFGSAAPGGAILLTALLVTLPFASFGQPPGEEPIAPVPPAEDVGDLQPDLRTNALELPIAAAAADALHRLEMERGKSVVVRTEYAYKRVSVGDPEIADFVVLGTRELQIVAKAIGNTNVMIWDRQGRLQSAIDIHVGAFRSQLVRELQRVLGNPAVSVDMAGESIVLRGNVPNLEASEQATLITRAFFARGEEGLGRGEGEPQVINLLEVGGNQQVMIEITIAELSREVRRNLGTNFSGIFGDLTDDKRFRIFNFIDNLVTVEDLNTLEEQVFLDERVSLFSRFVNEGSITLDMFLEALEEERLLKILAEPTLVARSGQSANFLVGGEIPIPVPQGQSGLGGGDNITIEFKPFGISLEFIPTVFSPERIHLEVTPEVSEPDFAFGTSIAGTRVPAFQTRRASTGVELADGQAFAIAGLLRDDIDSSVAEYPWLGDVPILGALFRSTEWQQRQTELVVIVQPHLVKPLPPGPIPLPFDHYIEPTDYELYLLGRLEGKPRRGPPPPPATSERMNGGQRLVREPVEPRPGGLIGEFGHRLPIPAPKDSPR